MASPQAVRVSFALALSDVTVELDQGSTGDRPPPQAPLITPLCLVFGLTPVESRALMALMEHPHISREALHVAMSRDGNPVSKIKIVDVTICKMRKKLNPHGIEIATVHGLGFRLAEGALERIRRLLADSAGATPTIPLPHACTS